MVTRIYPENLKSIGPAIAEHCPKTCLEAVALGALVSITGGPFDVSDVLSNTYNVFLPLVVIFDYRLRENNNTEGVGWRGIISQHSVRDHPKDQF